MPEPLAHLLADGVLLAHAVLVLFIVGLVPLVVLGARRGWAWVGSPALRLAHAAAIGCVVAESWLGLACPLTVLESWLRIGAGGSGYARSFVGHWVQRLLFYDAEPWVFTLVYSLFAALVLWTWWRFPPRRGGRARSPPAG
jgi:hypothetical protein